MNRRAMVRIPLVLAAFVLLSGQYGGPGMGEAVLGCAALTLYAPYAAVECARDKCPWDPEVVAAREAAERFRRANAGEAGAQFEMYVMSEAASDDGYLWLCRSASAGYVPAQFELMEHYLGEGRVPRTPNYNEAYKWLTLFKRDMGGSVGLPHPAHRWAPFGPIAQKYETEMANWLTQEEMATAEALVRDWQPDPAACAARAVEQISR